MTGCCPIQLFGNTLFTYRHLVVTGCCLMQLFGNRLFSYRHLVVTGCCLRLLVTGYFITDTWLWLVVVCLRRLVTGYFLSDFWLLSGYCLSHSLCQHASVIHRPFLFWHVVIVQTSVMMKGYCLTGTAYGDILSSFRHLLFQHVILLQKLLWLIVSTVWLHTSFYLPGNCRPLLHIGMEAWWTPDQVDCTINITGNLYYSTVFNTLN